MSDMDRSLNYTAAEGRSAMKIHWITAAFLSSAIAVGCGDRAAENTQNAQETEGTSVALAPGTEDQAPPPAC